ncbi:MAG TPA: copper transporter, partial [Micromonosporaceae bacterium]|nr:copper transporter [Micromonosporaceae bacterium]
EVRGDPALAKTVSTVDNVATAQGRIVTAMALVEQLRLAISTTTGPNAPKAGHYGIEAGATSLMPKRQQ